ncbi:hypothetical protein F5B17DRAFT_403723 [Nemania serpens]|nr:hypothetical protein F5B17DRAFT_403723 [Nemania serpens]
MGTGMQRYAPWVIRVLMFKIIYPVVTWLYPDGQVRSPQKSAAQVVQAAIRLDGGQSPEACVLL